MKAWRRMTRRNERREGHSMFTAWNNQYGCEVSSSHLSLCDRHVRSHAHQELSKTFCGNQNADFQVYENTKRPQ